jgi:hypothetical protein
MRLLYATQFEVASLENAKLPAKREDVLNVVSSWISEWYLSRKNLQIDLPRVTACLNPASGHDLAVSANLARSENVSHTVISWSYPDENDGNLFWSSRIELAEFRELTEFSFQLQFDSMQYVIAPVEFTLRRPRIIGAMLRQFNCTCGDARLSNEPREVTAAGMAGFIQRIESRPRRLPIILVSRTAKSGRFLVDPGALAEQLAGIAEIYYLVDKWAAFALSNSIGEHYRCFDGAVRVYWPDFDSAGAPFSPIYLPDKINRLDGRLGDTLFRQLAGISAFRHATGPVITDAVELLDNERRSELEEVKAAARDRGDLDELLVLADQENAQLSDQNRRLQQENESLKANVALARENFRAMSLAAATPEEEADSPETSQEASAIDPSSVGDAVLSAKTEFADTLTFLDSALNSAMDSPFEQPRKASQAFLAMHEVCLGWRESIRTGKSMGSFDQAFERKGFEYKPRESVTSKGKWGEEYEATYDGRKVSIEPHLALGKGGPKTCLRIHFYVDREKQRFVIAHAGRHKTNTSS